MAQAVRGDLSGSYRGGDDETNFLDAHCSIMSDRNRSLGLWPRGMEWKTSYCPDKS